MKAWPSRCSRGPQKRIGMREEPAWASMSATFALSTCEGSSTSSPGSSPGRTVTPCSCSSPRTTRTSRMSGTLRSRLGPLPSSAATMAFGTRFFAPRTRISPSSGVPPWTSSTSSVPVMDLAFLELGGGQEESVMRPERAPVCTRGLPGRNGFVTTRSAVTQGRSVMNSAAAVPGPSRPWRPPRRVPCRGPFRRLRPWWRTSPRARRGRCAPDSSSTPRRARKCGIMWS